MPISIGATVIRAFLICTLLISISPSGLAQVPDNLPPPPAYRGEIVRDAGGRLIIQGSSPTTTTVPATRPAPAPTPRPTTPATPAAPIHIAGAITDIRIENIGTGYQTNIPVTFGQVFAQGDVSSSDGLAAKFSDGSTIPLQLDSKSTNRDGSLRMGVISLILPLLSAGQTQTIGLVKAAKTSSVARTSTDLINAGFTASVNISLGGTIYTASADALLKSGKFTSWLAGPTVNEWLVHAPLTTSTGVQHPQLSARFAIRSYTGLNKVRVDVTIENGWTYQPAPQNFTYDAQIIVASTIAYSKAALTQSPHTRWRKVFWWGMAPQINIKEDTAYIISTKAVPNYDRSINIPSSSFTRWEGAKTEPMSPGIAQPYMPTTGGRPDIGLMPAWDVAYLLTMDKNARDAALGMADLAGSWPIHYRDRNTDRPVSILDYPYISTGDPNIGDTINPATKKAEATPACGGVCTTTNVPDTAHQPNFAYIPYLVTGDYYYLEELQFWNVYNLVLMNPAYRSYAKGLLNANQVRGQAWALRALGEAAYITPDTDPLKAQFETFLDNNLNWYNANYTNKNIPDNTLGFIPTEISYLNNTAMAPWQDDFVTSAAGHLVELGYAKAKPFLGWKAKFPISRMTDPNFCWIAAALYNLKVRDSATSPIYTSMAKVYTGSQSPTTKSLPCASTTMASNLGLKLGEMIGYASSSTGYPSNMQPALAYSADSGATNGAKAWQVFMSRSVKPPYTDMAEFAIVPRLISWSPDSGR